ncbi:hypothetical protein GC163_19985 [bacterium]|nr:hypothetical protein [bacterium]
MRRPTPTEKKSIAFQLGGWVSFALTAYATYWIYANQPAITIDGRDGSLHVTWGWDKMDIPEGVDVRTIGGIETPRTKAAGVKPKGLLEK